MFLFKASDTTVTAICFTLLVLGIKQDTQDAIINELREVLVEPEEPISPLSVHRMVYLERVIRESLRLLPVGSYIARHATDNIQLGNYF